jgi:UDP-N-acetylmuramoylalanine--D-glutamate ligase
MIDLEGKRVAVVGDDPSAEAAASLARARGARVLRVPESAASLPGGSGPDALDLVVVSAGCRTSPAVAVSAANAGVPVLGERELAFQCSLCLHVAVTGASGKSTTVRLISHLLRGSGRRVEIADFEDQPACGWVEASRDLDFLVHAVAPAELEHFKFFRPVVGVLLNAPSDHPGTEASWDDYVRRLARLFAAQQAFDWAIVQSEALAHLMTVGVELPGKLITFSSSSRQADLSEERGLLISRMEGWSGPLWDLAKGRMRGPHFAEDALASLAVGRVLRLTLEQMLPALATFEPGPGRMECLGETGGVRWIDDSRSANLDALVRALVTLAPSSPERPFIWLIAGGDSGGRQFYDLGPVLSPRVRQAFVFGEASGSMRAAWSLFAPCSPVASLLDATDRAMAQAEPGDVILFSPACPSRDLSKGFPAGGPIFREAFGTRSTPSSPTESTENPAPGLEPAPNPESPSLSHSPLPPTRPESSTS